jgi:hypothetical protein
MAAHDEDSHERAAGRPLGPDLAAHVEAIVRAAEREARAAERAIAERRRSAEEEARRYLAAARLRVDAEAAARAARLETYGAAARRLSEELADAAAALTRELRAGDAETELPPTPWPATEPAARAERPAAGEPSVAPGADPRAGDAAAAAEPPAAPGADPRAGDAAAAAEPPAAPWPPSEAATAPPAPEPTWARVEHEPPAPPLARPAPGASPSAARLVAIEMAVGGASRADVERHLRDELGVGEPEPLLDDVFGPASHAASRLAWGEP